MTTPDTIFKRLQNDFDCRLSTEQFLSIINILEKRLAVDVVRRKIISEHKFDYNLKSIDIDVNPQYITRVFYNGCEIKKRSLSNPDGYVIDGTNIDFANPLESGVLVIERIYVPEDYDNISMLEQPLFAGEGHDEIYIYHILSREALMCGNIDMVNNYSLLYAEALSSLKAEVDVHSTEESETEESETEDKGIQEKYKNIW